MAKQHPILVLALVAYILHALTSPNLLADAATTAYDVLEKNNLPRGLLPQGIQSFTLNAGGYLEVTLPGECNFFVTIAGKQFQFRYSRTVSGVIESGSISEVGGVRVQVAFAWLGFIQVDRDGDQLKIQLETSTHSFPVSTFSQSPSCS